MKQCRTCGQTLELTEFYKHSAMADGHLNICKSCTKKRVSLHREKNIDAIREYDRSRSKLPHRLELSYRLSKEYRAKHPDRYAANTATNNALRFGRIQKLPCLICGEDKVEAHHPDYSRPLDVIWLCNVHHKELHQQHEENYASRNPTSHR